MQVVLIFSRDNPGIIFRALNIQSPSPLLPLLNSQLSVLSVMGDISKERHHDWKLPHCQCTHSYSLEVMDIFFYLLKHHKSFGFTEDLTQLQYDECNLRGRPLQATGIWVLCIRVCKGDTTCKDLQCGRTVCQMVKAIWVAEFLKKVFFSLFLFIIENMLLGS